MLRIEIIYLLILGIVALGGIAGWYFPSIFKRRIQAFLNSNPNGMLILDSKGKIVMCNHQLATLLGYTLDEMMKRSIEELIPNYPSCIRNVQGCSESTLELNGKRKDGTRVPLEIGLNSFGSKPKFTASSIIDITQRKKAEQEIVERKGVERKLTELNQSLTEFAYIISHDLKAPLRGVSSIVDWLIEDHSQNLDLTGKAHLTTIKGRVTRMSNMIDGILKYARLEWEDIQKEVIESRTLVLEAIDLLNPPRHIQIRIVSELPQLTGVKVHFQQVFQNLISNAIAAIDKEAGEIRIGCRSEGEMAHFTISDNGKGIPAEHFEKIFKIFQTLTPRDIKESTGIGLTIVKKIIELHHGIIYLESQVNEGSTFHFTLPKESRKLESTRI